MFTSFTLTPEKAIVVTFTVDKVGKGIMYSTLKCKDHLDHSFAYVHTGNIKKSINIV